MKLFAIFVLFIISFNASSKHSYLKIRQTVVPSIPSLGLMVNSYGSAPLFSMKNSQKDDITGQRFSRLTAIRFSHKEHRVYQRGYVYFWLCKCDCGNEKITSVYHLRGGGCKSCGCLGRENSVNQLKKINEAPKTYKYGISAHSIPEYMIWKDIRKRCFNKNHKGYKNYGGRGITMSEEWRSDFMNFYNDMGERPTANHSIERKNVNGNYCKDNCCWLEKKYQARNTTQNVFITVNGKTKCIGEWAEVFGIKKQTLYCRFYRYGYTEIIFSKNYLPNNNKKITFQNEKNITIPSITV